MIMKKSNRHFKIKYRTFTFIIFSLILFSQTLIYAADVTLAWSQNNEPDLSGYYIYYKTGTSGAPYKGTGVDEGDSPIKIPIGVFADPSHPEYTLHGLSDTTTTYLVLTAFDSDGNESGFSNEVSYQRSPILSSLSINGSDYVSENDSDSFVATAIYSEDTTEIVTGNAIWSEDSIHASINNNGVLTVSEVTEDSAVTIQAVYTIGGINKTAIKVITIVDVPKSNLAPNMPIIISPEMGQTEVEVPLDIASEDFSDPNSDAHIQSQWQISEQNNFSTCVVDVTGNKHLTTFSVPHMVLKPNQKYFVRVRFFDVYFAASNWSDAVKFTTANFVEDLNSNGISDTEEVDDTVDFNFDGIPDNFQPHIIKCVKSSDGSVSVGIEIASSSANEIESLEMVDPDTIFDTVNRPTDLIFGLFSYRLRVNEPGDIAKIKIYFSGEIFASDTFYKYDTINGWYDYSDHTIYNDDRQSVTLELKDGGYGDSDGLANGVIVDPGGIATGGENLYLSAGPGTGGKGCFIATAAFGSKYENHVQMLRRFRDLYLMPYKIGRNFVKTYYKHSPFVADFISEHDSLRTMVRFSLIPLLGISWLLLNFGVLPTLLFVFLIGFTALFCYRKITIL